LIPLKQNWRALAEKASKEQDPEKLLILVEQLLEALKPELAGPPPCTVVAEYVFSSAL
jgi:hypothetical protein